MTEKIKNRIQQTCTGSGQSGNLNISAGSAAPKSKKVISIDGYQVGDRGIFCLESQGNYEIFYGTVLDSKNLSRGDSDDFIESSTGTRLDLNPDVSHTVYSTLDADSYVYVDSNGKANPGKSILRGSTVDVFSDLSSVSSELSSKDIGAIFFVLGNSELNDGDGGFYRWSGSSFQKIDIYGEGSGNGSVNTNLTGTPSLTSYTIESSSGLDHEITAASESDAGVMTAQDKEKLNSIETGSQVNPTSSEIKFLYESNSNTNVYSDAHFSAVASLIQGSGTDPALDARIKELEVDPELTVIVSGRSGLIGAKTYSVNSGTISIS
jgi:hypothetical protein